MLINFRVANFLSYYEMQEFSMLAGTSKKHQTHLYQSQQATLLKGSLIYGANASGKSNLIKSIAFAKQCIVGGISNINPLDKNYKFKPNSHKKETVFEFDILIDNKIYSYSFSIMLATQTIIKETLIEVGQNDEKILYERKNTTIDISNLKHYFNLDPKDNLKLEIYAEDIKKDVLLLNIFSNISLKSTDIFSKIFNWFDKSLLIIFPNTDGLLPLNFANKELFLKIMRAFDLNIHDIEFQQVNFEDLKLPPQIKNDLSQRLITNMNTMQQKQGWGQINNQAIQIEIKNNKLLFSKALFNHSNLDDQKVFFDLALESDGTKRLIELIPLLYPTVNSQTIFIDEIERSLHPILALKFLELSYATQKTHQMIITTHESRFLDLQKIRRDEIWFTEPNINKGTQLYSLEVFTTKFDNHIDEAYLIGRFGGIPNIKDLMMEAE